MKMKERQTLWQQQTSRPKGELAGDPGTQEDAQRLSRHKVKKLQGKVLGLTTCSEHQRRKLKDMNNEVVILQRKVLGLENMIEELTKCNVEKDKDMMCYKALLKSRTEELVKAESECSALRKKLAAVKSTLDTNLDEKVNTAVFSNVDNNDNDTVGVRKKLRWDSRQPQHPKAATGGTSKGQRFTKSTYLKAVEDKFQDNKEKYYEIIQVVKDMDANKIEISDARKRVKDILEGHQELVSGFDKLIAQNFKTQLQSNDRVFNLFRDLEGMYRRKSISKTDFYREVAILLRMLNDFVPVGKNSTLGARE